VQDERACAAGSDARLAAAGRIVNAPFALAVPFSGLACCFFVVQNDRFNERR
jgi:hypothetical protein